MPWVSKPATAAGWRRWLAGIGVLLAVALAPGLAAQTAAGTPAAPRNLLQAGDTRETIIEQLGQPRSVLSRGALTYLEYPEGRIVLENGRATEIPTILQAASAQPAPSPLVPTGSPPPAAPPPLPPSPSAAAPPPPVQAAAGSAATVIATPGAPAITLPEWYTSIPDAQRAALQTVRPLVVLFLGSSWNPASEQLRNQVLTQPAFKQHAAAKWVGLMIDLPKELPDPAPEWMQAYADFAKKYDVTSYPTILVLDQGGFVAKRLDYTGQDPQQLIAAIDGTGGWSFKVPLWAWGIPIFAVVYLAFLWWDKRAQKRRADVAHAPEFEPGGGLGPPVIPKAGLAMAPSVDLTPGGSRPPMKPPAPLAPRVPVSSTPPVFRTGDTATRPPIPGVPKIPPIAPQPQPPPPGAPAFERMKPPPPPPNAPTIPSLSEALAAAAAFSPGLPPVSPPPEAPPPVDLSQTMHPLPPLPKLPEKAAFAPPPPLPPGGALPGSLPSVNGGLMGAEPPPVESPPPKPGPSVLEAHRPKLVMPKPGAAGRSGNTPVAFPPKPGEPQLPASPKPSLRLSRRSDGAGTPQGN